MSSRHTLFGSISFVLVPLLSPPPVTNTSHHNKGGFRPSSLPRYVIRLVRSNCISQS